MCIIQNKLITCSANDFPRSRKTDEIRGICSSKRKTGFEFEGKKLCNFIDKKHNFVKCIGPKRIVDD